MKSSRPIRSGLIPARKRIIVRIAAPVMLLLTLCRTRRPRVFGVASTDALGANGTAQMCHRHASDQRNRHGPFQSLLCALHGVESSNDRR